MGLAIGIGGCLIILQFVSFELSYNKFHENSEDIFRISYSKEKDGVESFNTVLTYAGVGPLLKDNFPEVIDFARLHPMRTIAAKSVVTYQDIVFEENQVYYADPSFLTLFSFKMLEGDPLRALNEQFTVVITESTARKYFGELSAIGKILRLGNDLNFTVTGIIQDVPINSHVKFDFLLSHSTLNSVMPDYWTEYNITRFHGHLYVQMKPHTDIELFKSKLPKFVDEQVGGLELKKTNTLLKLGLMPLEDIHLKSNIEHESEINGDIRTVNYFSIIAMLILLIAWVNYINLSTATAIERANEVGVRKVLGAFRWQLTKQFIIESVLIQLVAIFIAIGLVFAAQPFLKIFGAAHIISGSLWSNTAFWIAVSFLFIGGVVFSGLYPAFILAGFKPVDVLKGGKYKSRKGAFLRKSLVVFQFSASVALLIGTTIVYLQMNFLRNQDLGVNLDRAIVVQAPLLTDSTYDSQIQSFKSELINKASINSVVATFDIPGREFNSAAWYKKPNETDDLAQFCYRTSMDEDFIPSMDIDLIAGRNFVAGDHNLSTIINKSAARLLGFPSAEEAVGHEILILGTSGPDRHKIIGVIKDYHHLSLKQEYSPLIITYSSSTSDYFIVKFNVGDNPVKNIQQTISHVEEEFKSSFVGNPLNYFFLDREFEKQYNADQQFGSLFGIFAILAIIVACLGLFGLSSYTVLRKTKEIGIRKVLGSSVIRILVLLWKDYLILVLIANLISWPIIYYLMRNWLDGFVEHIPLYWWLFPIAGILITLIALLTVSTHSIKAATRNPVKSLRYE